jgi:hypothetical protein
MPVRVALIRRTAIGALLAVLAVAVSCAVFGAAKAHATESYYCEVTVAKNTHCNDTTGGHTWTFNQDYYPGGTLYLLCQGMSNGGVERGGTGCLYNAGLVAACYGTGTVYWTSFVSWAPDNAHPNEGPHTLDGYTHNLAC